MADESILGLLNRAIAVIATADNRAMAVDGPVGHVRDEMSDLEWRQLYLAIVRARDLAAGQDTLAGMPEPKMALRMVCSICDALWVQGHECKA